MPGAATVPRPSCRDVSAISVASPAPQRRHKNASTPSAATTTLKPFDKVTLTTMVVTPTSAIRPPGKAAISIIPTASPAPRHQCKNASAPVPASLAPRPSRKDSSAAVISTLTPASRSLQETVIATTTTASKMPNLYLLALVMVYPILEADEE
ncbi:hypothetical protein ACLOJK_036727, partial [Asimina triloba]